MLRNVLGGPYKASCVFDINEVIYHHLKALKSVSGGSNDNYIDGLVTYALWEAGRRTNVLDPKVPVTVPFVPGEIKTILSEMCAALEPALYKTLTQLQFNGAGFCTLRPDRLVYSNGEVWLCWKTRDLY